jgi:Flp pilus assembly protein TadG
MKARGHFSSFIRDERGNTALGFLIMLALIVLVAALADLYALLQAKTGAYQIATDAALQGVAYARDYGMLYSSGNMSLDPVAAEQQARSAVATAMAARGITGYVVEVRVLPHPGGGTINDFPPVAQAAPDHSTTWTTTEPSVGVYVQVPVPVFFARIINGRDELPIHAFASAGLAQAQP